MRHEIGPSGGTERLDVPPSATFVARDATSGGCTPAFSTKTPLPVARKPTRLPRAIRRPRAPVGPAQPQKSTETRLPSATIRLPGKVMAYVRILESALVALCGQRWGAVHCVPVLTMTGAAARRQLILLPSWGPPTRAVTSATGRILLLHRRPADVATKHRHRAVARLVPARARAATAGLLPEPLPSDADRQCQRAPSFRRSRASRKRGATRTHTCIGTAGPQ